MLGPGVRDGCLNTILSTTFILLVEKTRFLAQVT